MRVRRESRPEEDGYRSELAPGLRSSADARRLAQELAFSADRLAALASEPPGLYGEARSRAAADLEGATWTCFLLAYLSPAEGEDPFAGVRAALAAAPAVPVESAPQLGELLDGLPRGPRSSHEPGRGAATLQAYGQWVGRSGGSQAAAFTGDGSWTAQRRFSRLFERLALPGLSRAGRYELLVSLGQLGLYELRAESLHLDGRGGEDATTLAAKRVFGIADTLLIDRRAAALAAAAEVPLEALDLALANWAGAERASMGHAAGEVSAAGPAAALGL